MSLTDLARYANPEEPKIPVQTWMRNKNVVSFLGLWEQMHNPNFKGIEFETFENEAGKNSFYLSPQKWMSICQIQVKEKLYELFNKKKRKKDCKDVAHVVPDSFLEELKYNENERVKMSYEKFDVNNNHQFVLEIDNEVVGFVKFGVSEDEQFENCGEIFALYIIKKYKGNGFGRKLVEEAIKEIKQLGCNKMIIACLKENPSNDFYKHIGGKYIKDGVYKRLNLPENIYYYEIQIGSEDCKR